MPRLLTLRQSPSIARALILEARAARSGGLGDRLRARIARLRANGGEDFDVVARGDHR